METAVTICFAYAVEYFVAYLFFESLFTRKTSFKVTVTVGALLYILCTGIFLLIDNTIINILCFTLSNILFGYFFFDAKIGSCLVSSLFLTVAMVATEFIVMSLMSMLSGKSINVYRENHLMFFIFMMITKTAYLIITKTALITGLYFKGQRDKRHPVFLLIYPVCSCIILYSFWVVADSYVLSNPIKTVIFISSIAIILSIFLTYVFYSRTSREIDELFISQSEAQRVKTDITYYELLDSQNEKLKAITHDEKNHLSAIKSLANSSEVSRYIDSIYDDIENHSMFGNTQNKYLDLLLNKYQSICDTEKISFDFSVRTVNLSFMEPYDLITLIGNILDNAVESARNSQERQIHFITNNSNTFEILTCTNSCDKKPHSVGKTLYSTKTHSGFHGLGVKSIKKIAEKYYGEFDWNYNENTKEFVVNIMFFHKN